MLAELYNYFVNIFRGASGSGLENILTQNVVVNDVTLSFRAYLATIASLISITFIVVLCCLFIWKLIKVVGRLFMGA